MIVNVLCCIPNRSDATSFYRAMGPLADLRRRTDINLVFVDKIDEATLDMMDVVFMQRPSEENHLTIAKMCENTQTPLWIDYDDFLLDVPEDNPSFEHYGSKKTKENVIEIIRKATVVTVSTQQIKRCLQPPKNPLNQRVYVIPNALPDRLLSLAKPFDQKKNHINWRGTNTHQRDIAEYGSEIIEISRSRRDLTFTFIGYNPWFITQYMPHQQTVIVPAMTIGDYFRFISSTSPPIQIVPLHRSMFNMCKSNIAWLEATLAGGVTIAPDWEEWKDKPGVLTYKDGAEFKHQMQFALGNRQEMARRQKQAMEHIQEWLMLSGVNTRRFEILDALIGVKQGNSTHFPDGGAPVTAKEVLEEPVMELE